MIPTEPVGAILPGFSSISERHIHDSLVLRHVFKLLAVMWLAWSRHLQRLTCWQGPNTALGVEED